MNTHQNATRWMLVLLGLLLQGQAMAFTQPLYLFSEVEGTVLLDGQPVEGVEVEQEYHWHWKNEHRKNSVKTGANGRFHVPAVTGKSLTAGLIPMSQSSASESPCAVKTRSTKAGCSPSTTTTTLAK